MISPADQRITAIRSVTVSPDLVTAYACRAAALAAVAVCIWLATGHHWLAFWLVLWLVPTLLLVGGRAHAAHTKRTEGRA